MKKVIDACLKQVRMHVIILNLDTYAMHLAAIQSNPKVVERYIEMELKSMIVMTRICTMEPLLYTMQLYITTSR
jgi:hypothetical protein